MTIKKTMLASLIALTTVSGMAYADSMEGAISELKAITAGMSQAEINQKIERFIERAPEGTSIENALSDFPLAHYVPDTNQVTVTPPPDAPVIDRSSHLDSNLTDAERNAARYAAYQHNNPEGTPTHQTGPATHLDGTHQATVTPHLDAPVIDRTSHLDSNVTDAERDAARYAAYQHNNPEGTPTHQTGPTTHLDGTHQDTATPHLDAPVIDRTSHLDSNVTDAERNAVRYAAYQHNNPEATPTHQTGPATHLDGTHQATVTPHLDAPVIDRSSHLDSNVTDAERNAARYAAYQHNNPEGTPTHQTGPAIHLDGTHQDTATPHLDAPVIDRTSHLDSNVTDAERNAVRYAAYQHNNPEGNPTHQTGPATHLDGTHQDTATPHLDAPVIDRTSHLDNNVTDAERNAVRYAAYQHNNPEGTPTHQTGPATHLDGTHQDTATPHLDAPVIDRSSHLDNNVTDAERDAARYAAYQHNNPEGNPTHQTGPATHLDGTHQDTATPHLDAPVIDRTSHLDSNVTDAERNAARYVAYQHNNPEGTPTHQTGPATHLDGQHNVTQTPTSANTHQNDQRKLTEEKYAAATVPQNGVDGKNGADGKKGANGKDADMTLVNANTAGLRGVRSEQVAQGRYVQQNGANIAVNQAHIANNTAAISKNSQDIAANRKDIDENSKDIKRVGAMAQAVSSLHYNRNESGYAVAAGEYDGEASIAGGMQFSTSQDSAVTLQVSWDGNATGAGVGFHSNF